LPLRGWVVWRRALAQRYNPQAAKEALGRTMNFFKKNLKG